MYIEHNYDKAAQMWDTVRVKQSLSNVFSAKGTQNMSLTLETLMNQYYTYFKKVHNYTIVGKIEIGKIQKKDSLQRSFVTYRYTEKVDDKRTNAEAILILTSKDFGNTWDILDMKFFN